jgi:hypothetical protein
MRRVLARGFSVVLVLALLHPSGGFGVAAQVPDAPARVSVATDGTEGNGYSVDVALSSDNIFLLDRQTGATTRVSVASDGAHGDNASFTPTAVFADGRYVAFWSWATNLVSGDTNEAPDVFIHDLANHQTTRVSAAWDGGQGNGWSYDASLSSDGRYVAFVSEANNLTPCDHNQAADVFVHDRFPGLPTPPDPLPAADHQLYLPLVNQRC